MSKSSFYADSGASPTATNAIENSVSGAAASATASASSATAAASSASQANANIAANQTAAAASEAARVVAVAAKVSAESARDTAITNASNSSTSATASNTSKVASQASEAAAATSQSASASSATSAATSATLATAKASAASISQASAATSASNAASSAAVSLPLSGGSLTGNLSLPVNGKVILGTSVNNSLQIFNDGSNSIITESSAGSLLLRGTNLSLQDASNNNYVQALSGGAVTLYDNSAGSPSPKIATTSSGASISGNIAVTGTVDGRDVATDGTKLDGIAASANNYVLPSGYATETYVGTQITALVDSSPATLNTLNELAAALGDDPNFATTTANSIGTKLPLAGGSLSGNLDLPDNIKIRLGASQDLEISHESAGGGASIIKESGSGNLKIYGSNLELLSSTGEQYFNATQDGIVQIYCDNVARIKTSGTGASIVGNLVVSGTVDGRDVATDGTKLDGVEASADVTDTANVTSAGALMDSELTSIASVKALNQGVATGNSPTFAALTSTGEIVANGGIALGDNDKATFGAGDDLQIYHDGYHSYIKEIGAGSLILEGANIIFRNPDASKSYASMTDGGAIDLYHNNALKLATTSTGIDVTGGITATDGSTITVTDNTDVLTLISTDADENSGPSLSLTRNSASPADNDYVGLISFNGENSADESIRMGMIRTQVLDVTDGTEDSTLTFYSRHGGTETQRLATTATGIDITGTATMDGLTVSSTTPVIDVLASVNEDASLRLRENGTGIVGAEFTYDGGDNYLYLKVGNNTNTKRLSVSRDTGDISFYEDTGTTAKLTWDASAESLGIGHAAPTASLDVRRGDASGAIAEFHTSTGYGVEIGSSQADAYIQSGYAQNLLFKTGNTATERMRIDASGRVGIGTNLPSAKLDIRDIGGRTIQLGKNPTTNYYGSSLYMSVDIGSTEKAFNIGTRYSATGGNLVFEHSTNAMGRNGNASALTYTERMRIDSSGNVLVGKTASNATTAGVELSPAGIGVFTYTGRPLYLNRLASDGNIIDVARQGTTVGSIGTVDGDFNIYASASGHKGLRFGNGFIAPTSNSTTVEDATTNLGLSTHRFKDLYLSGASRLGPMVGSPLSYVNGTSFTYNSNRGFVTSHTTTSGTAGVENGLLLINNDSAASRMSPIINFSAKSASGSYNHSYAQMYGVKTGSGSDSNWNSGALVFATTAGTGPIERMKIDSSGNLLVGKSGVGFSTNGVTVFNNGQTNITAQADPLSINRKGSSGNAIGFYINTGACGSITVTTGSTSYNTSSDQRLKENIAYADDAGSKVDSIQVRKFDWKVDGTHQDYGMVAQELQAVAPEAVSVPEDEDEMMGVDYSKLVPMLIKEIQSLRQRVAQLEE